MSDIRPPFTAETALQKVKAAQRLWNTRDPSKVVLAYTVRRPVPTCLGSRCMCDVAGHNLEEQGPVHEGER